MKEPMAKRFHVYLLLSCSLPVAACSKNGPLSSSPSNNTSTGHATHSNAEDGGDGLTRGEQCLADAATPRSAPKDAPEKMTVSHILVRHAELERPEGATRSREEACLRALTALQKLEEGALWHEVAATFSDAASGSLGRVSKDMLTGAFGEAAFSLEPNQLSYVVESDRGFHVILRED